MIDEAAIASRHSVLNPVLDERGRRRFAAAEARMAGRGGVPAVSRITGLAKSIIRRGLHELKRMVANAMMPRPGGGRKKVTEVDPTLMSDLKGLVEPTTRDDPQAPVL